MKTVAIICEYNPFHTGHKYQINKIRSDFDDAHIVCLMSSNFVQRGDCSILDKHTRGKTALKNGANLVIEMPLFFCTQVAPIFAKGSISTLNALNCIDYLCFGSETNDISNLQKNAKKILIDEKNITSDLKQNLKQGKSFISSYSNTLKITPNMSNDILGIEYIKALIETNSKIKPYSIQRLDSSYNDKSLSNLYSSATSIRYFLKNEKDISKIKQFIPNNCISYFDEKYTKFDEDFYKYIKYSIITKSKNLDEIFEVNEGIENLIIQNIKKAKNLEDLIKLTKSKRYTYTKIRRIMFNILLDIKKAEINQIKSNNYKIPYVKLIGFDDKGRDILKKIKSQSDIEIINKLSSYKAKDEYSSMFLKKELNSTQIYNLDKKSYYFDDFLTSPIYLKNHNK